MFFDCYSASHFLNWYYVLKLMERGQQGGIVGIKPREVPAIINIKMRAHNFKNVLKKNEGLRVLWWVQFCIIP